MQLIGNTKQTLHIFAQVNKKRATKSEIVQKKLDINEKLPIFAAVFEGKLRK